MKQSAFYARVSTSQQEEQGTIASQVTILRERIAQDGCHLDPVHEFTDDSISGSYLARPGLDRLRDLASEGTFDVLYMRSPDRLARRYAHQRVVLEELDRWGTIGQPKKQGRGLRTANCRDERSCEEWIPITVPQIVSMTIWEQVQAQLDMDKRYASRNNK